ncbi:MAG: hypothetical protein ABSH56_32325 [Bryobacteraceae bacterium]
MELDRPQAEGARQQIARMEKQLQRSAEKLLPASVTRSKRTAQALEFLTEPGPRGGQESLAHLRVRDVDAHLQQRCLGWRRRTIEGCTVCLRSICTAGDEPPSI